MRKAMSVFPRLKSKPVHLNWSVGRDAEHLLINDLGCMLEALNAGIHCLEKPRSCCKTSECLMNVRREAHIYSVIW